MPRHIQERVDEGGFEQEMRRLNTQLKNADVLAICRKKMYFTKPSETKRREQEQAIKRFKRPQPIKAYKEMGNQKMVRFTKHEQQKYV